MKYFSCLIPLFFFVGILLMGCGPTRIYIVRHAEKALDGSKDPTLNSEGDERAKTLASVLRNRKIERFYATETARAEATAKPLAVLMKKSVLYYAHDTMPQFIIKILDSAVNTLIVGHSNTVLKILFDMGLNPTVKEIGDNEYDNLFIVSLRNKNGRVGYTMTLDETRYGKPSTRPSQK
jgi:broad specificity phosphatase PhoE